MDIKKIIKNEVLEKKYIVNLIKNSYQGLIILNYKIKAERVLSDLNEQNINSYIISDYNDKINDGFVGIYVSELNDGLIYDDIKFFIFTEKDIFGISNERTSFTEMVHVNHAGSRVAASAAFNCGHGHGNGLPQSECADQADHQHHDRKSC